MRIAVDVMGGDHGCQVIVAGVKMALEAYPKIERIYLVGPEAEVQRACEAVGLQDERISIRNATQVLTMDEKPLLALRRKKDCSILRTMELVKDGEASAAISPGNTGGLVAAATIRLRPLKNVDRAALAAVMPTVSGEFIMLDAGANAECKPHQLVQFAVMGDVYSREILNKPRPRVGVLSNGTEEIKGNDLTRATLELLRQTDLNVLGYVEGHDLFEGNVDVVVTDGFIGNIVLKSCESLGKAITHIIRSELTANPIRKAGALLAKGGLRGIRDRVNPDSYGGAPMLGLRGNVIKAHGSAREFAMMNAVRVAMESVQQHLSEEIDRQLERINGMVTGMPGSSESNLNS